MLFSCGVCVYVVFRLTRGLVVAYRAVTEAQGCPLSIQLRQGQGLQWSWHRVQAALPGSGTTGAGREGAGSLV